MKLAVNLTLSLLVLAICLWAVWPDPAAQKDLAAAFRRIDLADIWLHLVGIFALLCVVHFCRSWRWNNLLRPIGATLPPGRLLAISSVGFMAILALPARLGEFVRPALIRRRGQISAAAALGTVAVERIVDGLLVSVFVFGALFARRGPDAPGWMMPVAYTALAVFASAMVFLAFALRWPKATVRFCVNVSLIRYASPRAAEIIEDKLESMISGFQVLEDRRNMAIFVLWSLAYWTANGLSVYLLAQGVGLELSVVGAFATMGLVAVGITLPNSPGLVGQYQWFTQVGVSLYVGEAIGHGGLGLAFAILLHGIQVVWYIGAGAIALASPYVSISEVWRSRSEPLDADEEPSGANDAAACSPDPGR